MARSENEVDQIVFRWDSENVSGSTGFGPVAWSAPREEVETLFGIFGALLRASGEETRPALLRLHQRAGVLLIRRTPWTDPGGRSSVICHALVGPPELLDPATCLGLHGWNWEGAALPLADVRGPLDVVPARALARSSGPGLGALDLPRVEAELVGTAAELLRNPQARFTLLDERGDAAPAVLSGLHGMFGGLVPDRRWTFASHDTVELPALRFVFVGQWAGAASRNTDRRRVDPRERLGDRAEEVAARLVHHHLWALSEGDGRRAAAVADALCSVPGADHLPLLETAERALTTLDRAASRGARAARGSESARGTGQDPESRGSWDTGAFREHRDARDRRDPSDPHDGSDPREPGYPRESRDPSDPSGPHDRSGPRESRYPSDPRESREFRDPSDPRDPRGARDPGDQRDPRESREEHESRVPRGHRLHEEPGHRPFREDPEPRGAHPLPEGGELAGAYREAAVPREAPGSPRAPHDATVPGAVHGPVAVPVVPPEWRGPEGGARWRLPRPRRRGRVAETGLVRLLAASADDAEARIGASADGELLDALRRPQSYTVTTLLMREVARRLPSWDHPLRREFRDLVIGQELFATAPRSTHHDEPGEAERAANAAALHRWAVRPLLDEGNVPAGALVALLSRLRSSPVPAARAAFRQIVDDERPGLPEEVWRALLREAYAQPPASRPPAPASRPPAPGAPPLRTVAPPAPPPQPPRQEVAPPAPSGGDDRVVVFAIVAVLAIAVIFIVSYLMTGDG
ncbi:hypothetical protein [Streptomyces sp. NPDC046712]|uniref:hypothetical protein n=1 Tax=Streptomyces sp. NPDC046712 TaxID=3154802 RepID=UPI0033C5CB02